MKTKISLLLIFTYLIAYSQTNHEKELIIIKTNVKELTKLKKIITIENHLKEKKINLFLKSNPSFNKIVRTNNTYKEIIDIIDDKPIYRSTNNIENVGAAASTKTNHLQPGGSLGLNLEGNNMTAVVWDGGTVLSTHQEFNEGFVSRIVNLDLVSTSDHATHVAGTIAANGTNANAKGMAPKTQIKSYDWTDDTIEIINEVSTGLLLSNHSYGIPVSSAPTWMMGCYGNNARNWDLISNNAPYYLSVLSAGNDGSTTYPGGLLNGYDKLTGNKNSKNNLVIANARPFINATNGTLINLILNSSSSQGPSDDGRVKPDLTADGTDTYSPIDTNDTAYATYTGTSMASPNTTGTLVLLQEYFNQLNGVFLKAATLKALVIHTAEKGVLLPAGPSPKYGFGLLNAKDAAELITADDTNFGNGIIKEKNIINNSTYIYNFSTTANGKIKATICWNDPAGTSQEFQLNSATPALVNDLDIRISDGTTTYYPWKLDLANINGNAIQGDNIVDNVEKIEFTAPSAGNYTLTISHKGNLVNSSQDYGLIISGQNVNLPLDVNSIDNFIDFNIFPNPTNGKIKINLGEVIIKDDISIKLFDQLGKLVFSDKIKNSLEFHNKTFNFSIFSNGIYYLNIKSGEKSSIKKIILN